MFRAWCEREGAEVLLTVRRIRRIAVGEERSEIEFTCWCGHVGRVVDLRLTPPVPSAA